MSGIRRYSSETKRADVMDRRSILRLAAGAAAACPMCLSVARAWASGSQGAPPCSERVIWTVHRRTIAASRRQIAQFAELFPMNARPLQPLNRRLLLEML